ncbi:TetR/AcrR family transcriptional regulator [Leekyejoonella antrihumi]|nr:TetR family transcriptional regulator [Leekyejoonella antrihumi]
MVRNATRRGTLSADRIVAECLAMLDERGPSGLTFRKIGARLGVDPTALYRHFRSKDELILAIMDHLIEQALDGFTESDDWRDTIRDLLQRSRAVYLAHPHAAVLGTIRVTRRDGEMRIVEIILGALELAGFTGEQAARLYRVLDDLNLAFGSLDAGFRILDEEQQAKDQGAWSREYAVLDASRFPRIARATAYLPLIDEDSTFALALDLTIEAIAARAAALPTSQ